MNPNAATKELKTLLDLYSSGAVTAIAYHHSVAPKGSKRKAEIINILARALPERERVLASLKDLSKAERATLDVILQHGGKAGLYVIRKELLRQKLIDASTPQAYQKPDPRRQNSRRLDDVLARLTLRGLVFSAEDPYDPHRGYAGYTPTKRDIDQQLKTVFIPEAIRQHLPEPAPLPDIAAVRPDVSAVTQSSTRAFQRELYLYWSFVRDNKVSVTAKGELHKRVLVQINDVLLHSEKLEKGDSELQHPRLRFMRGMLTALGLISVSPEREVEALSANEFFALPPADRAQRCYAVWREGNFYNDLLSLPRALRPIQSNAPLIPASILMVNARRSVLTQISQHTGNDWVAIEALSERMREIDAEFLLGPPLPYYSGYYGYERTLHQYSGNNQMGLVFSGINDADSGWEKIDTNFIQGIISGPLFWLGLTDLGGASEAQPSAFRLTELGAWLLGKGKRPAIAIEGGRVIVQPNLHIVALDPVNESTLAALDQFAERLSAERAVEYQLTRAAVYAGQLAGWEVARIKSFLQETTGADVPANVARTLDEWQMQHERIIIRPRVALAHGASSAINELLDDSDAAQYIATRPTSEVVLLRRPSVLNALMQSLHTRGVLPVLTTRPEIKPNSIVAYDDGRIEFTTRTPSLYLHGHLAAIADPDDAGNYRISAKTIVRATRSGMSAPAIIERLARVQRGALPETLVQQIRAWAKHYGDAALEEVTLLQLRDEQTLNELLADPEVGPLLKRFAPASNKALARVDPDDIETLHALLAERGVDVSDTIK